MVHQLAAVRLRCSVGMDASNYRQTHCFSVLEIIDRSLAMGHRITSVLSALNIARSTYYQWKNWQPSTITRRNHSFITPIVQCIRSVLAILKTDVVIVCFQIFMVKKSYKKHKRHAQPHFRSWMIWSGVLATLRTSSMFGFYLANHDPSRSLIRTKSEMTKEFANLVPQR